MPQAAAVWHRHHQGPAPLPCAPREPEPPPPPRRWLPLLLPSLSALLMLACREELDPDFEKEYQQIMFESQGKVVPAKAPVQLSLAPAFGAGGAGPGGVAGSSAGGTEAGHKGQGQYHQHQGDLLVEEGGAGGEDNMAFKLLMKRGGKDDRSREILVRGVYVREVWESVGRGESMLAPAACA